MFIFSVYVISQHRVLWILLQQQHIFKTPIWYALFLSLFVVHDSEPLRIYIWKMHTTSSLLTYIEYVCCYHRLCALFYFLFLQIHCTRVACSSLILCFNSVLLSTFKCNVSLVIFTIPPPVIRLREHPIFSSYFECTCIFLLLRLLLNVFFYKGRYIAIWLA